MSGSKRQVPTLLQNLLALDVGATNSFCQICDKIIPIENYRKYYKALEISCHTLPWVSLTLASMWILWNESLFQSQINFFFGLITDIVAVSVIKAFVRRRRPIGNHSDMFLTIGPDQYSFPSGHVSRAVLITSFFMHLYPSMYVLHTILIGWAVGVSISRILLRRHHILDVIAGVVLGLVEAWFLSVCWISKSSSIWIVTSISDEPTNLEGLQDEDTIIDHEL